MIFAAVVIFAACALGQPAAARPPGAATPIAALQALLRSARPEPIDGYYFINTYSDYYNIRLLYWEFPQDEFDIRVAVQTKATGNSIEEIRGSQAAIFAVNGGFFEIDAGKRIDPTGLVIVGGTINPGRRPQSGGSGVLYRRSGSWHIGDIGELRTRINEMKIEYALQNGPILVQAGGVRGVRTDNGSAVNRTAICLRDGRFGVLVVAGEITLSQLSQLMSLRTDQGGFGCDTALNLDGGQSTQASYLRDGQPVLIGSDAPPLIANAIVVRHR